MNAAALLAQVERDVRHFVDAGNPPHQLLHKIADWRALVASEPETPSVDAPVASSPEPVAPEGDPPTEVVQPARPRTPRRR